MADDAAQTPEDASGGPDDGLKIDPGAASTVFKEFDDFQIFRLKNGLEGFDRVFRLVSEGTSVYEKVILVDGAALALSITFLSSLSSRLNAAHISPRPSLWMVEISWILLIGSIYFSYRVIIDRHASIYSLLQQVFSAQHRYDYQRLDIVLLRLNSVIRGKVPLGDKTVEFAQVIAGLSKALKEEGKEAIKRIDEQAAELKKASQEGLFAKWAIRCTLLGIGLLCVFTVRSLRLLF